jgi:hypothetical protein
VPGLNVADEVGRAEVVAVADLVLEMVKAVAVPLGVAVTEARADVEPVAEVVLEALCVGNEGKAVGLAVPDAVGVKLSDEVALTEAAALAEARGVSELEREALSVALLVSLGSCDLLAELVSELSAVAAPEAVGRTEAEPLADALTVTLDVRVAESVVEAEAVALADGEDDTVAMDRVALGEKGAESDGCDVGVASGL